MFLSYPHKDKDQAESIFNILTQSCKYKVWFDKFEIKIGEDFAESIHKGIKNSEYFIACITKNYIESENCCNEFKLARFLKKKLLIVMFENIKTETTSIAAHATGIKTFQLSRSSLNEMDSAPLNELIQELSKDFSNSSIHN